jgi:hypothetical protein
MVFSNRSAAIAVAPGEFCFMGEIAFDAFRSPGGSKRARFSQVHSMAYGTNRVSLVES